MHAMVTLFLLSMAVQIAGGQSQPSFDIQGHRGARGLLPKNAMAGFLRAVDLGMTTLEIDVVIAGILPSWLHMSPGCPQPYVETRRGGPSSVAKITTYSKWITKLWPVTIAAAEGIPASRIRKSSQQ